MADEKYEIDYDAIISGLSKTLEDNLKTEREYFELIAFTNKNGTENLMETVASNMLNMPIADQVILLRAHKNLLIVCEFLQKKYNFEILEEDEDPDIY